MKDVNDKDFGQNTITLRDNRVATSIIPRSNAELDRQVIVDTNVLVEGSTYAKFLEISNGPAEFRKAVFADKELHTVTSITHRYPVIFLIMIITWNPGPDKSCIYYLPKA